MNSKTEGRLFFSKEENKEEKKKVKKPKQKKKTTNNQTKTPQKNPQKTNQPKNPLPPVIAGELVCLRCELFVYVKHCYLQTLKMQSCINNNEKLISTIKVITSGRIWASWICCF